MLNPCSTIKMSELTVTDCIALGTTNITFEFHRLTILLLRSSVKDDVLIGRKVATLTITDARIHAALASQVVVQGSLGGLQVGITENQYYSVVFITNINRIFQF